MITLYGIKNCGTMQRALRFLDERGIAYQFHDYKVSGIDRASLELWLKHFPADKLINTKGTTYRELSDTEKAAVKRKPSAVKLMLQYNSVIKRPVWDMGDGTFRLGFNEEEFAALFGG
jgi:arsenate reductase